MHIFPEFLRLPFSFSPERLAEEALQFDDSDWRAHPQGYPGNSALPLIATNGDPDDDTTRGPMQATPFLARCPYLRQILGAFESVWGRTRLMRIEGHGEATAHTDVHYYWTQRVRVHVPIITTPDVMFVCGKRSVHMAAGEAWIFDTWSPHNVINSSAAPRIHLVADTTGSAAFWELVARGRRGEAARTVAFDPDRDAELALERVTQPLIMSPWEHAQMIDLVTDALDDSAAAQAIRETLDRLRHDWRSAWAQHGIGARDVYERLRDAARNALAPFAETTRLQNGVDAVRAAEQIVLAPAVGDETAARRTSRFSRPIFIVSSPRAGSSLLFEALSQSPSVWTIGGESHAVFERAAQLHPARREWHSNRLTEIDARPDVIKRIESAFAAQLRNRDGAAPPNEATGLRLLEKTPKNALRVPFLATAFPDALFVYLHREVRDTLSSMLDAWRSGKFVTYPNLPDWREPKWSLLLTPGWRELAGKPLAEIVAGQWASATRYLLDDLERLPADRWCVINYDALLRDPQTEMERLARFTGIEWDRTLAAPLPLSKTTLTAPDPEKWRRNTADLDAALPLVEEVATRARALLAHEPEPFTPAPRPAASSTPSREREAFRSVHTANFAHVLDQLGISLLVSTYQSGRLVSIRNDSGQLNTHFRAFANPMGIALAPHALALGTKSAVWLFQNQPALANRMSGSFDACYAPRTSHVTGDIRIHELAYAGGELWAVNTRFSCLSTFDGAHSFVPRWRPRFVSDLAAEDRCHLNGMAVIEQRVRFVTALGQSNTAGGWRAQKATGGLLIDIESDEIVARGLGMPHSPRWYDGRLWVLESAHGRLSTIELATGRVEPVVELPGFTRGLAFAGPIAFVGLSQVREKLFHGIPIAEKRERHCGIWMVDTRSGAILGFIRFEGFVQEIFDVQVLRGIRRPEILEPESELAQTAFVVPSAALTSI